MQKIAAVLVLLACAGQGRRVQSSEPRDWEIENIAHRRAGEMNDAELGMANLKMAMRDPSVIAEMLQMLRDPETLAQVQEMMTNPTFQEQAKNVAPQATALKSFASFLGELKPGAAFNPLGAGLSRRDVTSAAATAAAALLTSPLAANADGATSAATQTRARQIYGSRIFRLQGASAEKILSEKPAFALFLNAYGKSPEDKATVAQLTKLNKAALAAAAKGDAAAATAAVKDIVKVGAIKELDTIDGGNFNPLMKRNLGSPATEDMEDQLGPNKKALYETYTGKVEPANLIR